MSNNAEIKSEYSRIRSLMLKRLGRALKHKPQSKRLQKEQATIKQHNIRDYFNKLTEKQQKRALESLQRRTENDKLRVQRKSTAKPKPKAKPRAKSDLERQVDTYKAKRDELFKRIKALEGKPYAIGRYLANAEKYLLENTPESYKKLNASERFNKLSTLDRMDADPLLTEEGLLDVMGRKKQILKNHGYEGGDNWQEEWKDLQRKMEEQRRSTSDADIDEENMEFWYHSGSLLSSAMADEHNRKLGYI